MSEKIILDYPHWVDQSEAASHTIRHVLSLPLFLFPFALDHWQRGWVTSHYHVENFPCLWMRDFRILQTLRLRKINIVLNPSSCVYQTNAQTIKWKILEYYGLWEFLRYIVLSTLYWMQALVLTKQWVVQWAVINYIEIYVGSILFLKSFIPI